MKDGVGSIIIKSINGNSITLNNEQYNKLLLLNKDKLTDTVGLKELISNGDVVVDASTLNAINENSLSNPTGLPANGTSCNDNNPLTINDIYTNNVCLGTSIVGTPCDDGNAQTSDDKYDSSGICVGIQVITNILLYGDHNPSSDVLQFDYIRGFDKNGNRLSFTIISTTQQTTFWLGVSNGTIEYNKALKNSTIDTPFIYGLGSMISILKFNGELKRFEIKGNNFYVNGDKAKVLTTNATSINGINASNLNSFGTPIIYTNSVANSTAQSYTFP